MNKLCLLVLAPSLPKSLNSETPWHFFQELEPLAASGVDVVVGSNHKPDYTLPGVTFRALSAVSLRRKPWEIKSAARYMPALIDAAKAEPRGSVLWKKLLRCACWNVAVQKLCREVQPDVVHSHWAFPANSGGAYAASKSGIPLVLTLRGIEHQVIPEHSYGACLNSGNQAALRGAIRSASAITVCCNDSIDRVNEIEPGHDAKTHRVYHAVDEQRLHRDLEFAEQFWAKNKLENRRVISYVARMEDGLRKGHHILIRAFASIVEDNPDCVLLLVGDGPDRNSFEALAKELGVADKVVFSGKVHPNTVGGIMQRSALTALPSFSEAFANVVFESLVMRTPVVAAAVGTPRDILDRFGIVTPVGDVVALANAIRDILKSPEHFGLLAEQGAAYVLENMSVNRRIERFIEIYQHLVSSYSSESLASRNRT